MVQISTASRLEASGPSAESRRREILAAASRIFRRRGFAAAGMREIAAELGMTAGNLYYYFASKEELLAYCQETTLDALLAATERILQAPAAPADQLRRLIVAHVVCLNDTYPGSLAHLDIEALAPDRRTPLARKRKRYERAISRLLESGAAAGAFVDGDPGLATLALLGALNWTVKWYSPSGAKSAAEVGERFADLFLDGLRRPGA